MGKDSRWTRERNVEYFRRVPLANYSQIWLSSLFFISSYLTCMIRVCYENVLSFSLLSLSFSLSLSFRNLLVFLAPLCGRHKIKSALLTAKITCVGFTLCVQPYDITIEKTLRHGTPEELAVYQNAIRLQRATIMLHPRLTAVPPHATQTFRAGDLRAHPTHKFRPARWVFRRE